MHVSVQKILFTTGYLWKPGNNYFISDNSFIISFPININVPGGMSFVFYYPNLKEQAMLDWLSNNILRTKTQAKKAKQAMNYLR